jgi:hypothetical protein
MGILLADTVLGMRLLAEFTMVTSKYPPNARTLRGEGRSAQNVAA